MSEEIQVNETQAPVETPAETASEEAGSESSEETEQEHPGKVALRETATNIGITFEQALQIAKLVCKAEVPVCGFINSL